MDHAGKALVIARYTFLEMLKSKMLWNVVLLGAFIALSTFVASEFTFGVPVRVAIDLGLGSLSLSGYAITIMIGIGLIKKETESRTIYLIISRPVSRSVFLVGKMLGLISFLILNLFLLSIITLMVVLLLGGRIEQLKIIAMMASTIEAVLLLCVVVFLSLVINRAMAMMGAIVLLVSGHAIGEVVVSSFVQNRSWVKNILDFFHLVLPGFYRFNLKDFVLYKQAIPTAEIVGIFSYGLSYSLAIILASVWVLNRKNLD